MRWCLDTGHLLIGGYVPAEFAGDASVRVACVYVEDLRADVATSCRWGELSLVDAVRGGVFCPLGFE